MPDHQGRSAIDDAPTTLQSAATTAATGTVLDVKGWANVAVQISGTYTTASTTFQIPLDGTNWVSTEGVNTATGVSAALATANGIYLVNCAGAEYFRANLTTIVGTSQTIGSASRSLKSTSIRILFWVTNLNVSPLAISAARSNPSMLASTRSTGAPVACFAASTRA